MHLGGGPVGRALEALLGLPWGGGVEEGARGLTGATVPRPEHGGIAASSHRVSIDVTEKPAACTNCSATSA